jgi:hypothetical protein
VSFGESSTGAIPEWGFFNTEFTEDTEDTEDSGSHVLAKGIHAGGEVGGILEEADGRNAGGAG